MQALDAVVIGAGVIGLAVGRALAMQGLETVVLERESAIGTGSSSRNSEVIHAGLYYPSGSLKARLCVQGREQLYAYCVAHEVEHRRCGKVIIATNELERGKLTQIQAQAERNGVTDLQWLDEPQARALEPELASVGALLSPSTGIIDSHGLMRALRADFEAHGGTVALRSQVLSIDSHGPMHVLEVGGEAPMALTARRVINAAGLWAPGLASRIAGLAARHVPEARFAKGSYFTLSGRAPSSRLIYPVPVDGGLGVHLTLDLAGQARLGPDVEWITPASVEQIDYGVSADRAEAFEAAVRRYWPGLPSGSLHPAYSGVRPKLQWQGGPAHDFVVQGPREHGVAGLVSLFGIESPGLTACLAIADEVLAQVIAG